MRKEQINEIIKKIKEVQSRTTARNVNPKKIREKLKELRWQPYFSLKADGGDVPNSYKYQADKTKVEVKYDRKRNDLWYSISRIRASKVTYGSSENIEINTKNRVSALCPQRKRRILNYLKERKERKLKNDKYYYDVKTRINRNGNIYSKYRLVVTLGNEKYHFNDWRDNPYKSNLWIQKRIHEGRQRIINRIRKDRQRKREIKNSVKEGYNLNKIKVTLQDSIEAGNCRAISTQVAKEIKERENIDAKIEDMEISASLLLEYRADSYTKRAIEHAALN